MAKWSYVTLLERVAELLGDMTDQDADEIINSPTVLVPGIQAHEVIDQIKQLIVEQARKDRKVKE